MEIKKVLDIATGIIELFVNKEVSGAHLRRTDEDAKNRPLNWPRAKASPEDIHKDSLRNASLSRNVSGVYILYYNGVVKKVGSAEIGVSKRMGQYYNLNKYCGLKEITESNRDGVSVVWQDCPVSKCNELESKLFRKYGKGEWAKRSPHSNDDTWTLLI